MKAIGRVTLLLFILIFSLGTVGIGAGKKADSGSKPFDNNGRKWRIGYCETEPFSNYAETLYYIIKGFSEYGWLENTDKLPYSLGQDDTVKMWKWLSSNDIGDYLEFPDDAHYTLSRIEAGKGRKPEDVVRERLEKNDLDLVIVMGTRAGQALSSNKSKVPLFVFSASNAYKSGIVKGITHSLDSHVWAHMDTNRFKRQLQVFNDIFRFKKLGIVYENTELGKSYASIEDIEAEAKERGFKIVSEFVGEPENDKDAERYKNDLKAAYERLSNKVDAFYITTASIDPKWLPELLKPFYNKKVPVFSQLGDDEVRHGALMSITLFDFPNMGRFGADTIIKAMKGEPVEKLDQVYENTPQIILNLEAARKTGYKPEFDILLAADKVYGSIEK